MNKTKQKLNLAKNLRELTEKFNITQKEFAKAINERPTTVNTWFTGSGLPRMDKLEKIADFFHVKYSDLIDDSSSFTFDDEQESILLNDFRKLNDAGKELAQLQVKNLTEVPAYQKSKDKKTIKFHSPPHHRDFVPVNSQTGEYDLVAAHDDIIDDGLSDEEIAELDRLDLEEMDRIDSELNNKDN